jgi:hypothetical protein
MGTLRVSLAIGACLISFLVNAMDPPPSGPIKLQKAHVDFNAYDSSDWAGIHYSFLFAHSEEEYAELRDALRRQRTLITLRTRHTAVTSPDMTPLMLALASDNMLLINRLKQDNIITEIQIKGAQRQLNARTQPKQGLYDELQAVLRARQARQASSSASAVVQSFPAADSTAPGVDTMRRTAMLHVYAEGAFDSETARASFQCNRTIRCSAATMGIAFLLMLICYKLSYAWQ